MLTETHNVWDHWLAHSFLAFRQRFAPAALVFPSYVKSSTSAFLQHQEAGCSGGGEGAEQEEDDDENAKHKKKISRKKPSVLGRSSSKSQVGSTSSISVEDADVGSGVTPVASAGTATISMILIARHLL